MPLKLLLLVLKGCMCTFETEILDIFCECEFMLPDVSAARLLRRLALQLVVSVAERKIPAVLMLSLWLWVYPCVE